MRDNRMEGSGREREERPRNKITLLRDEDRMAFRSYAELLQSWDQTNQEAYLHYLDLAKGFATLAPQPFDEQRSIVRKLRTNFPSERMDQYLKRGHNLTHAELRLGVEALNGAWAALREVMEKLELIVTEMVEIQERLEPRGRDYDGEPYLFFYDGMIRMLLLKEVFSDQLAFHKETIHQLGFDSAQSILPGQSIYWDIFRSLKQSTKEEVLQWLE